jgi:hypothetical protein
VVLDAVQRTDPAPQHDDSAAEPAEMALVATTPTLTEVVTAIAVR